MSLTTRVSPSLAAVIAPVLALLLAASPASAQGDDREQLLEDFVHYAQIARPDLAVAFAQSLTETGITNQELAVLVDAGDVERFDTAVLWALRVPELEDVARELAERVELGRLELARDGDRIAEAIQMLVGTKRQQLIAIGRLKAAGEYAVPALLLVVTDGKDERLKLECKRMIRDIGLPSVTPLCMALEGVDPRSQRDVLELLGDMGYKHAAPFLRDFETDDKTPDGLRDVAAGAMSLIGVDEHDVSRLYGQLARDFYDSHESLTPYAFEATNNVWSYDDFVGLEPSPVPTEIFSEIMAMKMAARALQLDSNNRDALALYVAANLKRENDLPDGADDPIFGESQYSPSFYATVFGTGVCQDVLALALDTRDTPLVRDAIAALAETTGGANLFGDSDRNPLLEALSYPDRRVQYESALTLARALPDESFEGSYRVVPILASAVRTGGESFALVVSDDEENRRQAVIDVERTGFSVVGAEDNVPALRGSIDDATAVDLVVVRMRTGEAAVETVNDLARITKTAAAPVLVLAAGVDRPRLQLDFRANPRVKVANVLVTEGGLDANIDELLERASGGRMTEAEAEAYAFEAMDALEGISISCTNAFDLLDAESSLLDALETRTGRARLLVAGTVARIGTDRAQRRLFDVALAASGGERIDLLDRVADSVKRFGDRAEPRHVAALVDLVANSAGSTAEAAARVHGALNMTTMEAVGLIKAE
ncbi:MAG: hypothetical protein GY715_09220 [Planctomycetes bacterium]|nr:hypothetical protein [Planctomycetota bacterium]